MEQPRHAKPLRLESLFPCGLALAAVLVFYTGLDNFLLGLGGPKPKYLVEGFAAAVGLFLVLSPRRPRASLLSPLVLWLLFYFGMTIAWVPSMKSYDEVWQILYGRCLAIVALASFAFVLDDWRARRTAVLAVAACIVLASALNLAELLSLIRFEVGNQRVPGRSAGLYFDSNEAALAITLGLVLVIEEIPTSWRMPLFLVSAIGVGATFSRSGAVCLALVFLLMARRKVVRPWVLVLGGLVGAAMLGYGVDFIASSDLLTENSAARLQLAGGDSGRIELALHAWKMFLTSPLVGNGIGATQIWDAPVYSHNMFLALAAEQGILGLLTFPALGVAILLCNRRALAFVIVLMAFGFFSHVLLGARHVLLPIAIAAAARSRPEAEAPDTPLPGERDLPRAEPARFG